MEKIRDVFADGVESIGNTNDGFQGLRSWCQVFFCGLIMLCIAVIGFPVLIAGLVIKGIKQIYNQIKNEKNGRKN